MRRRWLIACLLMPLAVVAADIRMLTVEKEDEAYVFDSWTYLAAPPADVFAVLLDYPQYPRISSVYKESRYIEPAEDGRPRVYTRAEGCILFVCREVIKIEALHVRPHTHISAVVEPEGSNLSDGRTDWWLEPEGDGTELHYRMSLTPAFWVPPLIGPFVIRIALKRAGSRAVVQLEQLAIERYQAGE
jgi:hypothetical protein